MPLTGLTLSVWWVMLTLPCQCRDDVDDHQHIIFLLGTLSIPGLLQIVH